MSACIAERLAIVSKRLSPLAVLERAMSRLMTSADSRLAAISKVVRVRVLFSKNRLNTLLPRSSGTFFTSRSLTDRKVPAVSRMWWMTARGSPSVESRWMSSPWALSCGLRLESTSGTSGGPLGLVDREGESAVAVARQRQPLRRRQRHLGGGERRLHRQFPAAAVDQHRECDAARAAEVEQLVERRAYRAAGVEHVV